MKKKQIKISRAIELENTLNFFTDPYNDEVVRGDFEIVNEDGTIHEKSSAIVKATKSISNNLETIRTILK